MVTFFSKNDDANTNDNIIENLENQHAGYIIYKSKIVPPKHSFLALLVGGDYKESEYVKNLDEYAEGFSKHKYACEFATDAAIDACEFATDAAIDEFNANRFTMSLGFYRYLLDNREDPVYAEAIDAIEPMYLLLSVKTLKTRDVFANYINNPAQYPAMQLNLGVGRLNRVKAYDDKISLHSAYEAFKTYMRLKSSDEYENVNMEIFHDEDYICMTTDYDGEEPSIEEKMRAINSAPYEITYTRKYTSETVNGVYPELLNHCLDASRIVVIDMIRKIGMENIHSVRVDGIVTKFQTQEELAKVMATAQSHSVDGVVNHRIVQNKKIKNSKGKVPGLTDLFCTWKFEEYKHNMVRVSPYTHYVFDKDIDKSLMEMRGEAILKDLYICGAGGSGKTWYVKNTLKPAFMKAYAPTNLLATAINGRTAHSAFNSRANIMGEYKMPPGTKHQGRFSMYSPTVIFIDEIDNMEMMRIEMFVRSNPYSMYVFSGDSVQIAPRFGIQFCFSDLRKQFDTKVMEGSHRFTDEATKEFQVECRRLCTEALAKDEYQNMSKSCMSADDNNKKKYLGSMNTYCANLNRAIREKFDFTRNLNFLENSHNSCKLSVRDLVFSIDGPSRLQRMIMNSEPVYIATKLEERVTRYNIHVSRFIKTYDVDNNTWSVGAIITDNHVITNTNINGQNSKIKLLKGELCMLHRKCDNGVRTLELETSKGTFNVDGAITLDGKSKFNAWLDICVATTSNKFQGHTVRAPTKVIVDAVGCKSPSDLYVIYSRIETLDQLMVITDVYKEDDKIRQQLTDVLEISRNFKAGNSNDVIKVLGVTLDEFHRRMDEKMMKRYNRILSKGERELDHICPVSISQLDQNPNHVDNLEYLTTTDNKKKGAWF